MRILDKIEIYLGLAKSKLGGGVYHGKGGSKRSIGVGA